MTTVVIGESCTSGERLRSPVIFENTGGSKRPPVAPGEALRKAIRDSTQPAAEIAAKAHLSPLALSKFLAGERDIHLETADRLAEVLGIKLAGS